jgi:bacteriocin-like protein
MNTIVEITQNELAQINGGVMMSTKALIMLLAGTAIASHILTNQYNQFIDNVSGLSNLANVCKPCTSALGNYVIPVIAFCLGKKMLDKIL